MGAQDHAARRRAPEAKQNEYGILPQSCQSAPAPVTGASFESSNHVARDYAAGGALNLVAQAPGLVWTVRKKRRGQQDPADVPKAVCQFGFVHRRAVKHLLAVTAEAAVHAA